MRRLIVLVVGPLLAACAATAAARPDPAPAPALTTFVNPTQSTADASRQTVSVLPSTESPSTAAPRVAAVSTLLPATDEVTTSALPTVTATSTAATAPPSTEAPLTLPEITLATVAPPLPTLPLAPPPPTTVAAGAGALGRLEIPKLGISAGLQSGIDIPTLNRGPGHWPGTALPGRPGNVVIAGHRTSYGGIFRYINTLTSGDEIIFDTANGRFVYRVTGTQIVAPDAMWIIGQGGGSRATLFACHPPGSTAQRIVVFASLAG